MNSIPFLESTPLIINDVSTPDETFDISDREVTKKSPGVTSDDLQKALKTAGYHQSTIKATIKRLNGEPANGHEQGRPLTNIFYQGSVFTYPKLEIEGTSTSVKYGGNSKMSLISKGCPKLSSELPGNTDTLPSELNKIPEDTGIYSDLDLDALTILKQIRINNLKNVIIGQLNINSLRNKFNDLVELIHGNLDILVITETKLNDSFPEKQFLMSGYKKPYRFDRNEHGGGVMIYVREDIPSDILLKHKLHENVEAIFVEINLRKNKILLVGTYHSTNLDYGTTDEVFFKEMGLALDVYSKYDKFLLAGDFNVNAFDSSDLLEDFLDEFHALNLVKDPTCYKSQDNPSCIDLFITNSYRSFQKTSTVTTGLSDFHKMVVTVLKTTFPKAAPRVITYRDYSCNFDNDFENDLIRNLGIIEKGKYDPFEDMVKNTLHTYYREKKRTVRANHKPWMTKELRKGIMRRSQLQNKSFKYGPEAYEAELKKQKNFCNRASKRARKNYCKNLNLKNITDNKKFYDTMKPLFSDKGGIRDRIVLVENGELISGDVEVAETFNTYFSNSNEALGITENKLLLNPVCVSDSVISKCIKKFEAHPSIIAIKGHVEIKHRFEFLPVTTDDMEKELSALNSRKNGGCIPTKQLKKMKHIVSEPLADIWNNECVKNKLYSDRLKLSAITPVYKALENSFKKNYRPISVLPIISKLFEKIMDKQIDEYIDQYLSKFLCGYRKGYNPQITMVHMVEKWKMIRDKGGHAGGVLMDLSKAFDTINHELLIAKLHAYGFSLHALELVNSYLSNRWHRTKINGSFSSWALILCGMPQGSVNGPKWFNIYINDLFYLFENTEVCNIADDTTPFACDADISTVIRNLESETGSAVLWYDANYMKLNQIKCHFIMSSNSPELFWIRVGGQIIWESKQRELLGVIVDKKLKFDKHIENICKKASAKVTALSRLVKIVPLEQKKTLMNAFIEHQFSYCPLVWMFCWTREHNDKINHIHERGLRMVYDDYTSSYNELLRRNGSVNIHHHNIQLVAIEMFKVKYGLHVDLISCLFEINEGSLDKHTFRIPSVKTEYMGKHSFRYFGPVVWELMLPERYKEITSLEKFKQEIKGWVPNNCKCRLCKSYVGGLGFVNVTE